MRRIVVAGGLTAFAVLGLLVAVGAQPAIAPGPRVTRPPLRIPPAERERQVTEDWKQMNPAQRSAFTTMVRKQPQMDGIRLRPLVVRPVLTPAERLRGASRPPGAIGLRERLGISRPVDVVQPNATIAQRYLSRLDALCRANGGQTVRAISRAQCTSVHAAMRPLPRQTTPRPFATFVPRR